MAVAGGMYGPLWKPYNSHMKMHCKDRSLGLTWLQHPLFQCMSTETIGIKEPPSKAEHGTCRNVRNLLSPPRQRASGPPGTEPKQRVLNPPVSKHPVDRALDRRPPRRGGTVPHLATWRWKGEPGTCWDEDLAFQPQSLRAARHGPAQPCSDPAVGVGFSVLSCIIWYLASVLKKWF